MALKKRKNPDIIPMRFWQRFGFTTWYGVNADFPPPANPADRVPFSDHAPWEDFLKNAVQEALKPPGIPNQLVRILETCLWRLHSGVENFQLGVKPDGTIERALMNWECLVLTEDAIQSARLCLSAVKPKLWKWESDPIDDWARRVTGTPPGKWSSDLLVELDMLVTLTHIIKKLSASDMKRLEKLRRSFQERAQFLRNLPIVRPFLEKTPALVVSPPESKEQANVRKLFLGAVPDDPNIVDLVVRLDAAKGSGRSDAEIARELMGETLGNEPKAKKLLARIRMMKNRGKLNL